MELKDILIEKNCSLVASDGYISYDSGIKPVISKLNLDLHYFEGLEVADKVVGKASAMLLTLSGVKKVYAETLSIAGKEIFEKYNVEYEYGELVDYIVNKTGDDMCPMEKCVKDIDDLNEAYNALYDRTNRMALH